MFQSCVIQSYVLSVSQLCCVCVSPEEERRVRANDREYNDKFQYAVREIVCVFVCVHDYICVFMFKYIT